MDFFYRIFWELISKLGVATQNFYDFIDTIVLQLNRITRQDYIITDCHSTDKYNCGRAMMFLDNNSNNKFLIYNTDSKGFMDINTQLMYLGCDDKKLKPGNLNIFGKTFKRIQKEILMLEKDFIVKIYENNDGVKLVLNRNKDIIITLNTPSNYPFESPSGTFNDLTISEIDLDWNIRQNLKNIVDNLVYKYNNNKFPKHKQILCYLLLINI